LLSRNAQRSPTDNPAQRNCIEHSGTRLWLRNFIDLAGSLSSVGKLHRALEETKATQPRNCAEAFLQLLSDACAGKLPSSLQNYVIFPCMHDNPFPKNKKASLKIGIYF